MPLHLVRQSEQLFGSKRKCCEMCGKPCGPYSPGNTRGHLWTEDEKEWQEDPLNCHKVVEPSMLLCDGSPTVEQNEIYEKNLIGHRSYLPREEEEDD